MGSVNVQSDTTTKNMIMAPAIASNVVKDANTVFQPLNVLLVLLTPETMAMELVHVLVPKSLVHLQVLSSVVHAIKGVQAVQLNMTTVHLVKLDSLSMMITNVFVLQDSSYHLANQLVIDVWTIVLNVHPQPIALTALRTLSLMSNRRCAQLTVQLDYTMLAPNVRNVHQNAMIASMSLSVSAVKKVSPILLVHAEQTVLQELLKSIENVLPAVTNVMNVKAVHKVVSVVIED